MEAIATHSFVPTDIETELSFRVGDKLNILNYGENVQWYTAEKFTDRGIEKGLVPENYIEITRQSWYMGRVSRSVAERMLNGNRHEGAFLVRLSESEPSQFSLSVKCGNAVQHFRILKDNDCKYFLWQERFNSLNALVDYYRTATVSRTSEIFLRDMDSDDQFVVRARYTFLPGDGPDVESELEFNRGDLITVFDAQDDNWWCGSVGDRTGYFPSTYVEPYRPGSDNR